MFQGTRCSVTVLANHCSATHTDILLKDSNGTEVTCLITDENPQNWEVFSHCVKTTAYLFSISKNKVMIIDKKGLIRKQGWKKKIKQKLSVVYFKLCNIKFKDDPCLVVKKYETKLYREGKNI